MNKQHIINSLVNKQFDILNTIINLDITDEITSLSKYIIQNNAYNEIHRLIRLINAYNDLIITIGDIHGDFKIIMEILNNEFINHGLSIFNTNNITLSLCCNYKGETCIAS